MIRDFGVPQNAVGKWAGICAAVFSISQATFGVAWGRFSDIYGRKPVLLVAYAMFALGNLGAGLGRSLGEVIAWRAVQGIGGAGMGSLVAIIIVDIVPMHDVASTRSYVNIMQTSGRTCGGVIGGWLTQTLGWRW